MRHILPLALGAWMAVAGQLYLVSDYRLDERATGVRSPAKANGFSSSLCAQTSSEAHPAFCTMGNGDPFPGVKGGRSVKLITHRYLVPRSRMNRSYTSSRLCRLHGSSGTALGTVHSGEVRAGSKCNYETNLTSSRSKINASKETEDFVVSWSLPLPDATSRFSELYRASGTSFLPHSPSIII
jgi:hypothetical protein